jgi:hypothetical protein
MNKFAKITEDFLACLENQSKAKSWYFQRLMSHKMPVLRGRVIYGQWFIQKNKDVLL